MIRCPVCRAVVDSADLRRHLYHHSTLSLLRTAWQLDWWYTLLTLAAFAGVVAWLWLLVLVVWP